MKTDRRDALRLAQLFRAEELIAVLIPKEEDEAFRDLVRARKLMSYAGLVPSEHSSGDGRWQGKITKAGNTHLRRIIVEAAWSYQHVPGVRRALRDRLEGMSPEIILPDWLRIIQTRHQRIYGTTIHSSYCISVPNNRSNCSRRCPSCPLSCVPNMECPTIGPRVRS